MKNKFRNIIIDDVAYIWTLKTSYELTDGAIDYLAVVRLTVMLQGRKGKPFVVLFHLLDDPVIGTSITTDGTQVSLNTPKVVSQIIKHCVASGWQPMVSSMEVSDGFEVLDACGLVYDAVVKEQI